MKRIVLLLTVLLLVAFGCQSQSNNDKASSENTREEATNDQHQEQATTSSASSESQEGSSQEGSEVYSSEASYAVAEGDSLWQISRNHLGPDASEEDVLYFTEDLYQANAGTIGDDPNLIFPDQVLYISQK